jgi:hypothetical protein
MKDKDKKKHIRLSEKKSPEPSKTRRITAFIILFIIIFALFFTIQKYGIEFFTFFIFVLLLLIPVIASFEKDISNFLGIGEKTIQEVSNKTSEETSKRTPKITSKTYLYLIIFIVSVAIVASLYLMYKSYKLENDKKDIAKLLVANIILINCGALISVTFN